MKRIALLLMGTAILAAACDNNKSKETGTDNGKDTLSVDPGKMKALVADMEKQKEELVKLTPVSLEELKALIPETLLNGKRTSHEAMNSSGANQAMGEYEVNDSVNIRLSIFDCAGAGGAGIYNQYTAMENFEQDTEEEYTKKSDINGNKGFEHCEKATNNCTITYFTKGRFLVTIEGDHTGASKLREAASELKLK